MSLVAVVLVILVGSLAAGFLSTHSKSYSISVSSIQMLRAYGERYLLTFSVTNKGSEPVTVAGMSINPTAGCTLTHVKGSSQIKPSESTEYMYVCAGVRLGEKYSITVRTTEGASAWATVIAVG